MNFVLILAGGCALFAALAIAATMVWYFNSRRPQHQDEDEREAQPDPISARGPQVIMPERDEISEGPVFGPSRPAQPAVPPQPVVIAPAARPMAPPPVAPAPPPAAAPRPVAPAVPAAMPRPNVAPAGRNIVERASPMPGPAAPAQQPAPAPAAARPATPPPPAPRPPPGVPAGVTIVPNDLTPFGMQNQARGPALRKKAVAVPAPIPPSDRKKDGQ